MYRIDKLWEPVYIWRMRHVRENGRLRRRLLWPLLPQALCSTLSMSGVCEVGLFEKLVADGEKWSEHLMSIQYRSAQPLYYMCDCVVSIDLSLNWYNWLMYFIFFTLVNTISRLGNFYLVLWTSIYSAGCGLDDSCGTLLALGKFWTLYM